jgi:hypothetical protein
MEQRAYDIGFPVGSIEMGENGSMLITDPEGT